MSIGWGLLWRYHLFEIDLATVAEVLHCRTRVAVEPASTGVWLRGGVPR